MAEYRDANISIGSAGGQTNALKYRIALPAAWLKLWEISKDNRDVSVTLDGQRIIIEKEPQDD